MRNCIMCQHWFFSTGCPDYSEHTPGEDWSSGCAVTDNGVYKWSLQGFSCSMLDWRKCIQTAINCDDYKPVMEKVVPPKQPTCKIKPMRVKPITVKVD